MQTITQNAQGYTPFQLMLDAPANAFDAFANAFFVNAFMNQPVEIVVGFKLVPVKYMTIVTTPCGHVLGIRPEIDLYIIPVTITVPLWMVL